MSFDWSKYMAHGVSGGPVSHRKDVRDLSDVELYLFLEGLRKFQNVDINDPLSYYQIAGIHGLPYQTWPLGNGEIPSQEQSGFCTHSSILFLTWHRPYLALFESTLYKHVNDIANGIDPSDDEDGVYRKAAKTFRLPYWDWARRVIQKDTPVFPQQALNDFPRPQGPPSKNSWKEYYNSLAYAPFLGGTDDAIINFFADGQTGEPKYYTTVRHPDRNVKDLEKSVAAVYFNKTTEWRNLSERVGYILNSYEKFASMSNNERSGSDKGPYGSFEDIHNTLHVAVGGTGPNGHMSSVPTSAFDPVFWLHHANVDRLFAIWQVLHQNQNVESWVTSYKSQNDTFSWPEGSTQDKTTQLYPFRKALKGTQPWFTSDDCIRTSDFGYDYAETAAINIPDSDPKTRAAVREKVKTMYLTPANTFNAIRKKDPTAVEPFRPQVHMLEQFAKKQIPATHNAMLNIQTTLPPPPKHADPSDDPLAHRLLDLVKNNKYLEWLVNIHAEKHTLNGAYVVRIFLGPIDEQDVTLWPSSPYFVGTFYPLGQPKNTSCGKCAEDQERHMKITSQIPLTIALIERYLAGLLESLDPEHVEPYLTKNLHWRVSLDGQMLESRAQVAGLEVSVTSNEVTLPENDQDFPRYAPDVVIYPRITTKVNGEGRGDGTGYTETA